MPMIEEMKQAGATLFRWRSYLPLAFFVLIIIGLSEFVYPFGSHGYDLLWELLCLLVGALGIAVRVLTVGFVPSGTSGRGTVNPTATRLNTTGMYSLTRNPIYLGNFLTFSAPVLFIRVWWVYLIFVLAFALYYERIIFFEELYLRERFNEEFVRWASRTPLMVPSLSNWTPPDLPFSWRMALRREYHGVFGVIASLAFLEVLGDYCLTRALVIDSFWLALFAAGSCFYLVCRVLAKRTTILEPGR
jgi:protein-S-isoprenylcysteine O-methyltransferase Ste14